MWTTIFSFVLGFFKNDKIFIYLSMLLLGALICLQMLTSLEKSTLMDKLKIANQDNAIKDAKVSMLQADLQSAISTINEQNEKFKALEVDIEKIKEEKNKIEAKFQRIPVPLKDDKCEAQLRYCRGLFKELSND